MMINMTITYQYHDRLPISRSTRDLVIEAEVS